MAWLPDKQIRRDFWCAEKDGELQPRFFGFVWADESGLFIGAVSDHVLTLFHADGTFQLPR